MHLFHNSGFQCSRMITQLYSTSFASAIRLLHKDLRDPIYGIYGFVRVADEIVDTFHEHDKKTLLSEFSRETWLALARGISTNPILHAFQLVVRQYRIPHHLIQAFLESMAMDLDKSVYQSAAEIDEYIYGSAEVVGLMCLCVFCEGDLDLYEKLKAPARKLGAAFQKVNFLRDMKADFQQLQRTYFPGFNFYNFDAHTKQQIEDDIRKDFEDSLEGIRMLPWKARFGVYTAYRYYQALFRKICSLQPAKVLEQRIRVPDYQKALIVLNANWNHRLNLI